jgi:hypothetical protein
VVLAVAGERVVEQLAGVRFAEMRLLVLATAPRQRATHNDAVAQLIEHLGD